MLNNHFTQSVTQKHTHRQKGERGEVWGEILEMS